MKLKSLAVGAIAALAMGIASTPACAVVYLSNGAAIFGDSDIIPVLGAEYTLTHPVSSYLLGFRKSLGGQEYRIDSLEFVLNLDSRVEIFFDGSSHFFDLTAGPTYDAISLIFPSRSIYLSPHFNIIYTGDVSHQVTLTSARLTAVDAIPEPTSWAMMIAGFALSGIALRRRSIAVKSH